MFGDSTTVADVRQILVKQAGAGISQEIAASLQTVLEQFEAAVISSFRYLIMSAITGPNHGGGGADEDEEVAEEGTWTESAGVQVDSDDHGDGEDEENAADHREGGSRTSTERIGAGLVDGENQEWQDGEITTITCQCECEKADERNLMELPVQVLVHIFSFLDAADIANVGCTCRQGYSLCADQILWRDILKKDKLRWHQVDHRSNPALYEAVPSDLTYKEIYMRCSPDFRREPSGFNLFKLPQLLWSFVPHKPPKVVMFGPGLESNTSTLVRKFLGSGSDIFKVRGVFPALLPGVGTGFRVSSSNGKVDMRLITMYSGTKRDREMQTVQGSRAQRSRLLQVAPDGSDHPRGGEDPQGGADDGRGDEGVVYEPTSNIQELCRNVDAFLFVVDASAGPEASTAIESQPELFALMNDCWTSQKCPLVILSCVPKSDTPRVPCVTLAKQLNLHKLDRTWKMFDATVADMSGVVEAVTWLVESAQGR